MACAHFGAFSSTARSVVTDAEDLSRRQNTSPDLSIELQTMAAAKNYHDWILDLLSPGLGTRVAEVGAGSGTFSERLLRDPRRELHLFEPGSELFRSLGQRFAGEPRVHIHESVLHEGVTTQLDSVVYVNVLEHIEQDLAELKCAHATLRPGGSVCIFVPALNCLMSDFDRRIGHFRRYSARQLAALAAAAGLRVTTLRYVDLPGILGWLLLVRLLRGEPRPWSILGFDRWVVPWLRRIEDRWPPPIGRNLVMIAQRED